MSDIFVSYASADRDRARAVAEALAEQGWSVWWDRTIPPGRQFDEVIEEALDSARCVVVLWSSASVASQWVKTEAADAMRRKILVPAMIEEVKIPLEFRRLQAADLSRWPKEDPDSELREFFQSIASYVGRAGQGQPASPPAADTPPAPPHVEAAPQPARSARADPEPTTRQVRRRGVALVGAGLAAIVAVLGYGLYSDHSRRLAREAAENRRAAEDTRRAAEEAHQKADEQRREAEEATARPKTDHHVLVDDEVLEGLANANREEAARRKAEEDRRAAAAAARRAKTAQEKAEREEAARRKAEEEVARLKAEQDAAARARTSDEARTASAPHSVNLRWRDNALVFTGTLSWTQGNANLRATAHDLATGLRVGNYDVPARVSRLNASDYLVSAEFGVRADSITLYPHSHIAGLVLRANRDGSLYFMRNCPPVQHGAMRQGECY